MTQLRFIRCQVFKVTQADMAMIAGTRQATVSRWEHNKLRPSLEHLLRIRAEANRRGLNWNDSWFFGEVAA